MPHTLQTLQGSNPSTGAAAAKKPMYLEADSFLSSLGPAACQQFDTLLGAAFRQLQAQGQQSLLKVVASLPDAAPAMACTNEVIHTMPYILLQAL